MALAGTTIPGTTDLAMQLQAKGIPILGLSGPPFVITYDPAATQAQRDQGDALAAAHDGKSRVYRSLTDVRGGIQALTATQLSNTWANLSGATPTAPRKYLDDTGPNAATIFLWDWVLYVSGPTTAQQKAGQISLIATYVTDYPYYLDHPPFDNTIAVLGVAPVP